MADAGRYLGPGGAVTFIEEQCVLADGRSVGEAMERDRWVFDCILGPTFERDDHRRPRYSLLFSELGRGHWKSGAGAAVGIAECVLFDSTEVIVAAADREQAGIIGENVEGFLRRNPRLAADFKVKRDLFEVP